MVNERSSLLDVLGQCHGQWGLLMLLLLLLVAVLLMVVVVVVEEGRKTIGRHGLNQGRTRGDTAAATTAFVVAASVRRFLLLITLQAEALVAGTAEGGGRGR